MCIEMHNLHIVALLINEIIFALVICEFSVVVVDLLFVAFSGITKYEPEKKELVSSSLVHFRVLACRSFPYRECVYYSRL